MRAVTFRTGAGRREWSNGVGVVAAGFLISAFTLVQPVSAVPLPPPIGIDLAPDWLSVAPFALNVKLPDVGDRQQVEPSLAIHPANSQIVVAGAQDYQLLDDASLPTNERNRWDGYWRSTNGGASWTYLGLIPGFPGDASKDGLASALNSFDSTSDPVVAFDGAGNAYYAGVATDCCSLDDEPFLGTLTIFVAKYVSDGEDFAGVTLINPDPLFPDVGDKPWIALDTSGGPYNGRIYVAFIDQGRNIHFTRSTDGGATFETPVDLGNNGFPGLAVGPDGSVYVAHASPNSVRVLKSTDGGDSFTETTAVFPACLTSGCFNMGIVALPENGFRAATVAQVAADSLGVYVVWHSLERRPDGSEDADALIAHSPDGLTGWSGPVRMNDVETGHQFFPSVATHDGQVFAIWYDSRADDGGRISELDLYYGTSLDGGATWEPSMRVTSVSSDPNLVRRNDASFTNPLAPFLGDYIQVAAAEDVFGSIHVRPIWADNRNGCTFLDTTPVPAGAPPATAAEGIVGCTDQDVYVADICVGSLCDARLDTDIDFSRGGEPIPCVMRKPGGPFPPEDLVCPETCPEIIPCPEGYVDIVVRGDRVRSTDPGKVTAWLAVSNVGGESFRSLRFEFELPTDWLVHPTWGPARGAIHVFHVRNDRTMVEITDRAHLAVSKGTPQTVTLSIGDLDSSAMKADLGRGEGIAIAVRMAYALKGTMQPASSYPRDYATESDASAFSRTNYAGSMTEDFESAVFTANVKARGR